MFIGIYDVPEMKLSLFYALNATIRPESVQLAIPFQKKGGGLEAPATRASRRPARVIFVEPLLPPLSYVGS